MVTTRPVYAGTKHTIELQDDFIVGFLREWKGKDTRSHPHTHAMFMALSSIPGIDIGDDTHE